MSFSIVTGIAELREAIFDLLDLPDIFRLGRASKFLHTCVRERWSCELFLSRFFSEPLQFLQKLESSGGVVAGDAVLFYLSRERWEGLDLNVFVPLSKLYVLRLYIMAEGYDELKPDHRLDYKSIDGVGRVYSYVKDLEETNESRMVQLVSILEYKYGMVDYLLP
jgi:hypothetical protein